MARLMHHVLVGIFGFWIATKLPGVEFTNEVKLLLLAGLVLGIINFTLKPIINFVTIPLKIITFGLFAIVLNMAIIWVIDVLILDKIFNLVTLFKATLILSVLNFILIKK